MTNPNDAIGTNGAFGGRTSVNAFNDVLGAFQSRGVLSGWGVAPSSGMTVACGGSGTTRDVAVAEDASGNKTTVNNISGSPVNVTLDSAPASNSRYDAIVVYVDKPPVGNATQDNPECCGIINVTGTAASTPTYPDDTAIRSAITADGASGATAYYAVIAYVLVASGTTTITSGMITAGAGAAIGTNQIANGAVTSQKVDWTTLETLPSSSIAIENGTVTDFQCTKLGPFIILNVGGILTPSTSWQTLWRLPSGWRPTIYISPAMMIADNSVANDNIQTDGLYRVRCTTSSASSGYRLSVVYRYM